MISSVQPTNTFALPKTDTHCSSVCAQTSMDVSHDTHIQTHRHLIFMWFIPIVSNPEFPLLLVNQTVVQPSGISPI